MTLLYSSALLRALALALAVSPAIADVSFRILHFNDVHGRVEPASRFQSPCSGEDLESGACFGGFAKIATVIKRERASGDVLVLDAGDQFLGTIWTTVYMGKATSSFQNALEVDAMCLGNHEFDFGPGVLGTYLDRLNFPVVDANIDASAEPELDGKIVNSVKVEVAGTTVGIVGFITPETPFLSMPGDNVVFLENLTTVVQDEIDKLKGEGVAIIIGLSHIGFPVDVELMSTLSGLGVVVGGHTHTKLEGDEYPTIVADKDGNDVAVVQAFWATNLVGLLDVTFSDEGVLLSAEGAPAILGDNATDTETFVEDDQDMLDLIGMYKGDVEAFRNLVVGESAVFLDGERQNVRNKETNLGSMICDAMVWYIKNTTSFEENFGRLEACLTNGGGIRASIDEGPVTFEEVVTVLPFGNVLSVVKLTPPMLYEALENGVRQWEEGSAEGEFPQVGGMKFTFCEENPDGARVDSVEVFDGGAFVPISRDADEPAVNVVVNNFIAGGGDKYTVLQEGEQVFPLGPPMDNALQDYITAFSPVAPGTEGRIQNICLSG
ncbi:unnamed protein product [Ostreobium quekettii]|uniref:5'-nucleotidase n=1 Tax=Ostreobium quekettii TaxID=121088 RepID=A0A8S1IYI3_9CHLO|nr:unnamed protein product [Ostreobium quekettii]|eukprot:evm.model.scf_509.2 EVM.evm.TU.scf_509.2   scf_509:20030-21679(-)